MTLKEYRLSKKLTYQAMADKLNIALSYYYKLESGERKPSRELISLIKNTIPEVDINIFLD